MTPLAFLFPGQGAQSVGMGKKLYDTYPTARRIFEEASDALHMDMCKLCFEDKDKRLSHTEFTQPAILTVSYAAFTVFMQEVGKEPTYLAGHSLGEITALTAAQSFSFFDAVRLVRARGQFMQEAAALGNGMMTAVGNLDIPIIEEVCKRVSTSEELAVLAAVNSPMQAVISGHRPAVLKVEEELASRGARLLRLPVSAPFHSPLMIPAAEKFAEQLKQITCKPLRWPVLANIDGMPYKDESQIIRNLTMQMSVPVRWSACMHYLQSRHISTAIDMGPQTIIGKLAAQNIPDLLVHFVEKGFNALTPLAKVPPTELDETVKHFLSRCMAMAVSTKNANWNDEEYEIGVVQPYERIGDLLERITSEVTVPAVEQMSDVLAMLKTIFVTKKVSSDEQLERINQIMEETGTHDLIPLTIR